MLAPRDVPFPLLPFVAALTRKVAPLITSRTKTSDKLFVSRRTRLLAALSKRTNCKLVERETGNESPLPPEEPVMSTLTRVVSLLLRLRRKTFKGGGITAGNG